MRRICTVLVCAFFALPATADAQQTNAPPGNSGIDQYVETVPSATGNRKLDRAKGGTKGISPQTRQELEAQGTDGELAADLAAMGAPADGPGGSGGSGSAAGGTGNSASPSAATGAGDAAALPDSSAQSPVQAVVEAVTGGTDTGSGMGPLLPILLALALASMVAAALMRRRSNG